MRHSVMTRDAASLRLRALLGLVEWTQQDLGEAVGVTGQRISQALVGRHPLTPRRRVAVAQALGRRLEQLAREGEL